MRPTIAILLAACLAGCAFFPPGRPAYFLLDPGKPPSFAAMRSGATAAVGFADVAIPFASGGFVYRVNGGRWETDPYNQFLVSPAQMMTALTRNWVAESGLFRDVAVPGEGGGQTYLINCAVTELYGDFQNPPAPQAVLAMRVQVFSQGRLVREATLSQSVPVRARTPEALVAAWNEALRLNLTALLKSLAGLAL
jgi:uncharacterized lipoprotein YmbA